MIDLQKKYEQIEGWQNQLRELCKDFPEYGITYEFLERKFKEAGENIELSQNIPEGKSDEEIEIFNNTISYVFGCYKAEIIIEDIFKDW